MTTVNEFFQKNVTLKRGWQMAKTAQFADGFSVSIQAGEYHYSTPRRNECRYYSAFELGFPSEEDKLLLPYQESPQKPMSKTIFGYVPAEVVDKLAAKHGGFVE